MKRIEIAEGQWRVPCDSAQKRFGGSLDGRWKRAPPSFPLLFTPFSRRGTRYIGDIFLNRRARFGSHKSLKSGEEGNMVAPLNALNRFDNSGGPFQRWNCDLSLNCIWDSIKKIAFGMSGGSTFEKMGQKQGKVARRLKLEGSWMKALRTL